MKTCGSGHVSEGNRCLECKRAANRAYMKAWRNKNVEVARARDRARYADPEGRRREASKLASQRWRDAHPERSRQVSLASKWRRIESVRAYTRGYQKAHLSEYAQAQQRRRARKLGTAVEPITTEQLTKLLEAQRNCCQYCDSSLSSEKHLEHRVPLARGGHHVLANLCWSCPTCNRKKGTKTAAEFMGLDKCA